MSTHEQTVNAIMQILKSTEVRVNRALAIGGIDYISVNISLDGMRTFEYISMLVCKHCRITEKDLRGQSRKRNVVDARMCFAYIAMRTIDRCTLVAAGRYLGNRDHSSISYYLKVSETLIRDNAAFKTTMNFILYDLKLIDKLPTDQVFTNKNTVSFNRRYSPLNIN